MAYDYLYLVNRLCYKLNEVPLTSSTFATAEGVYADFREAINAAILDIYQEEDNEWPFGWAETTFVTTIGTHEYTKDANALSIDWDSFYIKKTPLAIASLTQTSGTATATVSAGHQLETGDSVYISGATEDDYNGTYTVTVSDATTFTYTVSSSATSPATGSPVVYPPYSTKKLTWINWDTYRKEGRLKRDLDMIQDSQYGVPEVVVRKPDNNFVISPKPNRLYTVSYEYFSEPDDLVDYDDVPSIPEEFKETIVNAAIVNGYLFRDNVEEADIAQKKYTDGVNRMRRILIPQTYYMRVVD